MREAALKGRARPAAPAERRHRPLVALLERQAAGERPQHDAELRLGFGFALNRTASSVVPDLVAGRLVTGRGRRAVVPRSLPHLIPDGLAQVIAHACPPVRGPSRITPPCRPPMLSRLGTGPLPPATACHALRISAPRFPAVAPTDVLAANLRSLIWPGLRGAVAAAPGSVRTSASCGFPSWPFTSPSR